jgi:long-chain acyl-CoA synthetase
LFDTVRERVGHFAQSGVTTGSRVALRCASNSQTLVSALALLELRCTTIPIGAETTATEFDSLARECRIEWLAEEGCLKPTVGSGHALESTPGSEVPLLGLLSSGSTGKPKLVLRSEGQMRVALEIYRESVNLTSADRIMGVIPLEHSYGYNNVLLASVASGACIVFASTRHPRAVTDMIEEERVTLFPGAPLFFDLMAKFSSGQERRLAQLRTCISVGTALSSRIHDLFTSTFQVPLWQSYGASEAGPVCLNRTGVRDGEVLALGEVCCGVTITVIDEHGTPVPEGKAGEIVIDSPAVGIGYEGHHDGASRIEPGRFFTGDLGCLRDGLLYFHGRRKLLIAAAGHKVDPAEVEAVLRRHPKITDAAVVAHTDRDGLELVKALIVTREPMERVEVMDFCGQSLAPFKVPRLVEFRDSLPRNELGKLLRNRL